MRQSGFLHREPRDAASRAPSPADCCDSHQTHEEDAAQTHEIEVARQLKEATPEFMAAMSACLRLGETLEQDHPDTVQALQRAMMLAPPSMHDFVARQAQELDLIPEAHGYAEDDQAMHSLEAIAAKLGICTGEAEQAMDSVQEDRTALGLPPMNFRYPHFTYRRVEPLLSDKDCSVDWWRTSPAPKSLLRKVFSAIKGTLGITNP